MAPNLFRILLALVALYVLVRGNRDERQVGVIFPACHHWINCSQSARTRGAWTWRLSPGDQPI